MKKKHTEDSWNEIYPVGTKVRYWPVLPPPPSIAPVETETRSAAWMLGDGSSVVLVRGRAGGVYLDHLEVMQ